VGSRELRLDTAGGTVSEESKFDGVKVFSATKAREREELGEIITKWLADHPELTVTEQIVTQSSDNEFHCLTVTIFYKYAKRTP
jgi:hypothetical protein